MTVVDYASRVATLNQVRYEPNRYPSTEATKQVNTERTKQPTDQPTNRPTKTPSPQVAVGKHDKLLEVCAASKTQTIGARLGVYDGSCHGVVLRANAS